MLERICDECGEPCGLSSVDHSYRIGDTEEIIERWLCLGCDHYMYDEAMYHVGD